MEIAQVATGGHGAAGPDAVGIAQLFAVGLAVAIAVGGADARVMRREPLEEHRLLPRRGYRAI